MSIKDIKEIRQKCKDILLSKADEEITEKDKEVLSLYEGAGGLGERSVNGSHEILSEYYTPENVIKFCWALIDQYQKNEFIPKIEKVLEPSCGTGRFAKGRDEKFVMYEIDPVSSRIAKLLHPEAEIHNEAFQEHYFKEDGIHLKEDYQGSDKISYRADIDAVVGNPPYGDYSGKYKGLGEGKECITYPEYFLTRGLDELKEGGMLLYVIPSGFLHGATLTKAKEYIAENAKLVNFYRLPSNSFSATDIATDIVVFKKEHISSLEEKQERCKNLCSDNCYKGNENHILGEMSIQSFHNMIKVELKEGDVIDNKFEEILSKIKKNSQLLFPLGNEKTSGALSLTFNNLEKSEKSESKITNSIPGAPAKKRVKKNNKLSGKNLEIELLNDEEFNKFYGREYSEEYKEIWKQIEYDGSFSYEELSEKSKEFLKNSSDFVLINEEKKQWMPKILYASGNIYQKIDELENEKAKGIIGESVYEKNLKILESSKPSLTRIDKIHIKPNSTFAEEFKIKRLVLEHQGYGVASIPQEKEVSLKEDFFYWACGCEKELIEKSDVNVWNLNESISRVSSKELGNHIQWRDIYEYFNGEIVRANRLSSWETRNKSDEEIKKAKEDEKLKAEIKKAERMEASNRLFDKYIHSSWFSDQERESLEKEWNKRHNAVVFPEYDNIPIFLNNMNKFKLNDDGENVEFKLNKAQLRGINFLTTKGNGLLAYDVGVGKTHAGICATVLQMQSGRCLRPLIMVPKAVYPKWINSIKMAFPDIKVNELGNFSKEYISGYRNQEGGLNIEKGSISVCTYTAIPNISFTHDEWEKMFDDYKDIFGAEGLGSLRQQEREKEKINEELYKVVGKKAEDAVFFDKCGFDHITVDEAHNFKNLCSTLSKSKDEEKRSREYEIQGGSPSNRARNLFAITQYIQKKNNDRNVFLLTATPFSNSPLEVYSMLTYLNRKELQDKHLYNIRDFVEEFIDVKRDLAVNAKGELEYKQVVKSWVNLKSLQRQLQGCIDKVIGEDAGVVRPQRMVEKILITPTAEQEEIFAKARELMSNSKAYSGDVLKAIGDERKATLSPCLVTGENRDDIVKNSPKLSVVFDLIKKNWEKKKDAGQVVYMSAGVDYFKKLKDVLVNDYGIGDECISWIDGSVSEEKRERIQKEFNDEKEPLKILFGSSAICEGVDLNGNSITLYNMNLGWNPTEMTQAEGRIWRQGNKQGVVHIVYPLLENSSDPVIFQKLDEKKTRFDEIWNYNSENTEVDVSDINPLDIKYDLVTDPVQRANIKIEDKVKEFETQKRLLETEKRIIDDTYRELRECNDDIYFKYDKNNLASSSYKYVSNKRKRIIEKIEKNYNIKIPKEELDKYRAENFTERDEREERDCPIIFSLRAEAKLILNKFIELYGDLPKKIENVDKQIKDVWAKKGEFVEEEKIALEVSKKMKFESGEYYKGADDTHEHIFANLRLAKDERKEEIPVLSMKDENRLEKTWTFENALELYKSYSLWKKEYNNKPVSDARQDKMWLDYEKTLSGEDVKRFEEALSKNNENQGAFLQNPIDFIAKQSESGNKVNVVADEKKGISVSVEKKESKILESGSLFDDDELKVVKRKDKERLIDMSNWNADNINYSFEMILNQYIKKDRIEKLIKRVSGSTRFFEKVSNSLLLDAQMKDVSTVCSKEGWEKLGREIEEGQKPLYLLYDNKKFEVYDISQTSGKDIVENVYLDEYFNADKKKELKEYVSEKIGQFLSRNDEKIKEFYAKCCLAYVNNNLFSKQEKIDLNFAKNDFASVIDFDTQKTILLHTFKIAKIIIKEKRLEYNCLTSKMQKIFETENQRGKQVMEEKNENKISGWLKSQYSIFDGRKADKNSLINYIFENKRPVMSMRTDDVIEECKKEKVFFYIDKKMVCHVMTGKDFQAMNRDPFADIEVIRSVRAYDSKEMEHFDELRITENKKMDEILKARADKNNKLSVSEEENKMAEEKEKEKLTTLSGSVQNLGEVKTLVGKDGKEFEVVNFSLVLGEKTVDGKDVFVNCNTADSKFIQNVKSGDVKNGTAYAFDGSWTENIGKDKDGQEKKFVSFRAKYCKNTLEAYQGERLESFAGKDVYVAGSVKNIELLDKNNQKAYLITLKMDGKALNPETKKFDKDVNVNVLVSNEEQVKLVKQYVNKGHRLVVKGNVVSGDSIEQERMDFQPSIEGVAKKMKALLKDKDVAKEKENVKGKNKSDEKSL